MKTDNKFVYVLFASILFLSVQYGSADSHVSLDCARGRLSLSETDGMISLDRLDTVSGEERHEWMNHPASVPLWTITVLDPEKKTQRITSLSAAVDVCSASENSLILEWKNLQPGNLHVLATISARGDGLEWKLEWEVREGGYTLWDAVYPEIGPLMLSEKVHSIFPYGWGLSNKDLGNSRLEGVYPSAVCSMPFIAVSDGTEGVYLGVNDPAGYPLFFFAGKQYGQPVASFGVRHDVEGMGQVMKYRLPYTVTTKFFHGDWYESARIYRESVLDTSWGKIPSLAERTDVPDWLKQTDLWYMGICHDEESAARVISFAEYFQVPTSAHVYQWHEIPFDDHYPEYFPAKPGFKQAVEKVQQAGIAVMPYINGRLWDPATDSWKSEQAGEACSIDEKGEKYVEVYGSKVPLSPMCPSTELWKKTVTNLVDRLVNEVGVKAVYIDQISAAAAKRCFAKNHGHSVGGGTYWIQGYRDLLQRCLRVLPPGGALTTEENADPWNDLLQAWLMVNTPENRGEIIPLYPAVYGGRAISFGFQYIREEDFVFRFPFRLKMARAFVFGSQLGWLGAQVLEGKNKDEAEFLKRLCQARHAGREALQFGELLVPVAIEGNGTVSWTEDNHTQHTQPAVLASAWRTPSGVVRIAAVNVADEEQTVCLQLNASYGVREGSKLVSLQPRDEPRLYDVQPDAQGRWYAKLSFPPRSADVFTVQNP